MALPAVEGIADAGAWNSLFDQLTGAMSDFKTTKVTLSDDRIFADGNPARKAGLPEGARILAVNDRETKQWDDIRSAIHSFSSDQPLTLRYRLDDGEPQTVTVQRRRVNKRLFGLAFEPTSEVVRREGIGASIQAGLRRSLHTGLGILRMLGGIITGKVSGKALGGPIAIFDISYKSAKKDFVHFLYFLGILSINLAILNILPIPVLDGGHLLFLLIEAIRRKPLPERAMAMFQWAGFLFLILLMVFVVFNDLERILG
jgi:regulator of sigma E protease